MNRSARFIEKERILRVLDARIFQLQCIIRGTEIDRDFTVLEARIVKKELERIVELVENGMFDWQEES
jgi:hypothetical protein